MNFYTIYTIVVASIWSITTSFTCWLLGAMPPPPPCRQHVSHGSPRKPDASHHHLFHDIRAFASSATRTLFENILSKIDRRRSDKSPKRSCAALDQSAHWDPSTKDQLLNNKSAAWNFQTFCSIAFASVHSFITSLALSVFVFVSGLLRRFPRTRLLLKALDRLCRFLVRDVQSYPTLRASDFFQNFPSQVDPLFLGFLYLVLESISGHHPNSCTRPTFRTPEKLGNGHVLEGSTNGQSGRDSECAGTPTKDLTPESYFAVGHPSNHGSVAWAASTLSTILFGSIRSTTTVSFSFSLLSSASILLPHYLRINLSSSRRRDTVPEKIVLDGRSLGDLEDSGSGNPQRRTTRRGSKHPSTLNTNPGDTTPENEVKASVDIPAVTTPVFVPKGETLAEFRSPSTINNTPPTNHQRNNDSIELPEVSVSSPSSTQTLFLSSSSDFSDPFTLYSFAPPPTPSTPHPPSTLRKELTLVNDRSDFCQQLTNPLASFHFNDEFMKNLKLDGFCPIGQGSFGTVWKATGGTGEGRQYAVKIVKRVRGHDKALANEIVAMWSVSESRWAAQLDYWQASEDAVLLAMRYCMGGSLMDLWESFGCRMDSEVAVFYAAELILAIHDLHTRGIMHRDIKLDNIMLDNGHIRIADFGLALSFDHGAVSKAIYPFFCRSAELGGDAFPPLFAAPHNPHIVHGACGTPGYGPPEVWNEEDYSFGVDYFAMACTFHAMLTGDLPYCWVEGNDDYDLKEFCIDPRGSLTEVEHDFLNRVLAKKPSERLSVRRMKEHPIFSHIDWDALSQGRLEPPTLESSFPLS